jgi:type IX secretion system PorP/SprF family membrane protein
MKIRLSLFFVNIMYIISNAQDIHFSQTAQVPLLINPACAGVYDGWQRILLNHRNQWLGAGTQFMTSSFAADINIGKENYYRNSYIGLGMLFFNDVGGDSQYGMKSGSLTLSGILPSGRGHTFSAGIQGGFSNRSADFSKLTFNSQWNGTAFDNSIVSEESQGISFMYFDASAGLNYIYDASKVRFQRKDLMKFQFGISAYHLNRPSLNFTTVKGNRLYRKYTIHTGLTKELAMTNWALDASAIQVFQGPHYQTIVGIIAKYRFKNGSKITGHSQDAYFGFGSFFRWKDAFCPTIQIDWKGFHLGMSYDLTVSSMRTAYTGSLEFSLSYTNLSHALFKKPKRSL